jgi:L,D-transpeptidase YcbB
MMLIYDGVNRGPAVALRGVAAGLLALALWFSAGAALRADPVYEGMAYRQAVAAHVADHDALAAFYRQRDYAPLWVGPEGADRRQALLLALDRAADHGLPVARHDAAALADALRSVRSNRDLGRIEAMLSQALLAYARDIQSGVLVPSQIDAGIVREVSRRDPSRLIAAFARSDPYTFLRDLAPRSPEYVALMREKLRLESLIEAGGWGARVPGGALRSGDDGPAVVALRDRMIAMGYMAPSAVGTFDDALTGAVQRFQIDHGLTADGVAGEGTIAEINRAPEERLKSVIVAMERERWMNTDRGRRHVWVNLTDFSTQIIDDGKVTFETRAVIGASDPAKRTPEFSDLMTYMELNPDWTVPRGIIGRDYLPRLQNNPGALGHLQVLDRRGRVIPRSQIDFTAYSARSFPFTLRQAPGPSNALGTVKFMFPNPHAIYLHDTPDRHLFGRESRAYSNGCVRLNDPHDFAYALLEGQEADPVSFFQATLRTGRQTRVNLNVPVPIHLVYRTAFSTPRGKMNYRRDVYGRDGRIFEALVRAGVVLPDQRS